VLGLGCLRVCAGQASQGLREGTCQRSCPAPVSAEGSRTSLRTSGRGVTTLHRGAARGQARPGASRDTSRCRAFADESGGRGMITVTAAGAVPSCCIPYVCVQIDRAHFVSTLLVCTVHSSCSRRATAYNCTSTEPTTNDQPRGPGEQAPAKKKKRGSSFTSASALHPTRGHSRRQHLHLQMVLAPALAQLRRTDRSFNICTSSHLTVFGIVSVHASANPFRSICSNAGTYN
jgi:hypothetical protein